MRLHNNLASSLLLSSRAFVDRFVKSRVDVLLYIGWAIVVVFFLVIALDSIVGMPRRDSSVFIYVAQGLLDGEIPYLDRWDHKGPLIYLLTDIPHIGSLQAQRAAQTR